MNINELQEIIIKNKNNTDLFPIWTMTIEGLSREIDNNTTDELLKQLIVKYASNELKLNNLNQLKNKFLGMAAHELRNPLISIRGFSELILSGALGEVVPEQKEFIELINKLSNDSLYMVNELLDISVIERGNLNLELKKFNLTTLFEEKIKINSIIAQRKNIEIISKLNTVQDTLFDKEKLGQVIDNLFSNAIKYSPLKSTIEAKIFEENNQIIIEIKDNGPGISQENQAKLFIEYAKIGTKATADEKCTGLGLAICKKIIEAHHGSIGLKSEVGLGSTFYFSIKVKEV